MTAPPPNGQGADRLFNAHKSITFLGVCKSEEVKFFRLFSHSICKKLYHLPSVRNKHKTMTKELGALSVSYTHLDVYKRQLLEGGKHSPYPKLELVRAPVSSRPILPPEELLAVCTNLEDMDWGIPQLPLEDGAAAARWIAGWLTSQSP